MRRAHAVPISSISSGIRSRTLGSNEREVPRSSALPGIMFGASRRGAADRDHRGLQRIGLARHDVLQAADDSAAAAMVSTAVWGSPPCPPLP